VKSWNNATLRARKFQWETGSYDEVIRNFVLSYTHDMPCRNLYIREEDDLVKKLEYYEN